MLFNIFIKKESKTFQLYHSSLMCSVYYGEALASEFLETIMLILNGHLNDVKNVNGASFHQDDLPFVRIGSVAVSV